MNRSRRLVPIPVGPLEKHLAELSQVETVTPNQVWKLGQYLQYDYSYREYGWEMRCVDVLVGQVMPFTADSKMTREERMVAGEVLLEFLNVMAREDTPGCAEAVEAFVIRGMGWLTGGTDDEVKARFGSRAFTAIIKALSYRGMVSVPLMGSAWRMFSAYTPREHGHLAFEYHREAADSLLGNSDLPAVIAARFLWEEPGNLSFQKRALQMRGIRSQFGELGDLPEEMLLEVAGSQEPPAEWFVDVFPSPREPQRLVPPAPGAELD